MDNMISAVINSKIKPLHYSIEVMFAVNEKYGSVQNALELLQHDNKEGFEAARFLAAAMANDAELCRRAEGYDHAEMLDEKDLSLRMKPAAYVALRNAICQTITEGYRQEQKEDDEETDLGLLELRKKQEAGS